MVIRSSNTVGPHILLYERSRSVTKLATELVRDPFGLSLATADIFRRYHLFVKWGLGVLSSAGCILLYFLSQIKQWRLKPRVCCLLHLVCLPQACIRRHASSDTASGSLHVAPTASSFSRKSSDRWYVSPGL
jgi:hypothetical protein